MGINARGKAFKPDFSYIRNGKGFNEMKVVKVIKLIKKQRSKLNQSNDMVFAVPLNIYQRYLQGYDKKRN